LAKVWAKIGLTLFSVVPVILGYLELRKGKGSWIDVCFRAWDYIHSPKFYIFGIIQMNVYSICSSMALTSRSIGGVFVQVLHGAFWGSGLNQLRKIRHRENA
jgi:hypothetical protein